jgi:gliding motility-associated-like protein
MRQLIFTYGFFFASIILLAQKTNVPNFIKDKNVLGTRVFIENNGQYNNPLDVNEKVLFVYDHLGEKIFFTQKGLIYEMRDKFSLTEEEREAIEHGQPGIEKEPKAYYTSMNWLNANASIQVEASEKQSHYFTFGGPEYNSSTFNKIIYKNVYPNIDVEYSLPSEKNVGIKYNLIVHAGANCEDFKVQYSGDVKKIKLLQSGEVVIKTHLQEITEHAPIAWNYSNQTIETKFVLDKNILSFKVPDNANPSQGFVIDPWVTAVTTLSSTNYAYDVDYDFSGNTFVYGGNTGSPTNGKFKVAKYSNTGTLLWTFGGIVVSTGWHTGNSWSCNFKLNKGTGKTYVGRNNGIPYVIRLDVSGNYDNFVSASGSPNVQEVWNMEFTCGGDIQIFGGGSTSGGIISTTTGAVSNVTTFSPGVTGCCQDVVAVAVDPVGSTFVTYLGHTMLQNRIALIAPSFTNSTWLASTGFSSLSYLSVKNGYVGANTGPAVAFNALAVNMNYVFYYDGRNIGVYSKTTGSTVATTNNSLTAGQQGGIAVDDCNNIYLGGNGNILCYNFNGTNFSTLTPIAVNASTTNQYVYDVQFNKITQTLFVCGSGFVGTYSAAYSGTCANSQVQNPCNFGQGAISVATNSINCANLQGSATVTAIGGVGPYTYTWLPSGLTGSIATGLVPGTYSVIATDNGAFYTFTNVVAFTSTVPLSGNVISTGILNCFGQTNGTASVANISGGSGNQTYLWNNGVTTVTTPTIGGLGIGNYSVTVTDALTSCAFSQTFSLIQPSQLSVIFFASTNTICAGSSITLTAMGNGGTPGYSFSWLGGPNTNTYVVASNTASINNYSITAQDAHGCIVNGVTSLTFVANPVLTVNNVYICPLQTGTLNVSGASSYTWNNSFSSNTYTDNPLSDTEYTVIGSALSCTSSATASIILKPIPVPILNSNSPVCNGQNLNLIAGGGTSFVWSGPQFFSSSTPSITITAASPLNSGIYNLTVTAANTCTAPASMSLTVHTTPILSAIGATVCNNQLINLTSNSIPGATYAWSGPLSFNSLSQNPSIQNPSVSASGNYTVKSTSSQGCTNTAVANVTVTALPTTFPFSNSPICFGDNLLLNGNNTIGGTNYSWTGPNGFNSLLQNPSINNVNLTTTGFYTLTVTKGPCIVSASIPVLIHPLPTPVATNNGPICENMKLVLSASTASNNIITNYIWQGPNNFVAYNSLAQINNSQLNNSGVYTIQVIDFNGCKNASTTTVTILNNPTVSALGDTVCYMQPATLMASGANNYLWFSNNGIISNLPTAIIIKALNVAPAAYTVIGTAANTCTSSASAYLYTWALPQTNVNVLPKSNGCINTTFSLNAQGALNYFWKGPGNQQYIGKTLNIFATNTAFTGIYTLTGIDENNCRNETTTEITIHKLPSIVLSKGLREACVPFSSEYIFTPGNGSNPLTSFSWELDGKTYTTNTFSKVFNKTGTYIIKGKFTDVNGCSNTNSFTINAWPQPVADFTYSPAKPIENADNVSFVNTSKSNNITEWSWFFMPNLDEKRGYTSNQENTSYFFRQAGNYPVALVIKNENGCADSVIKVISVLEDFNVFVPNSFTPNDDLKNELFMPVTRGIKEYHFSVFNRWNEILYESKDSNTGWDGTYKGNQCKQDIYIWKLTILTKNNVLKNYIGEVQLIK